jgi:peptidoglycan hydrolase CwlO-like protein
MNSSLTTREKTLIGIILPIIFFTALLVIFAFGSLKSQLQDLEDQIQSVEDQIQTIEDQIQAVEAQIETLESEIEHNR